MNSSHRLPGITFLTGFLITLLVSLNSQAQIPRAEDAPQPLSPEHSAKKMRLPDGFEIQLLAQEPVVQEPSGIAFDEYGRVFVCELHGYNVEGEIDVRELNKTGKLDTKVRRLRWEFMGGKIAAEAHKRQYGKLKLLLDKDHDGKFDHAEVWADDLPPCYGVVPTRGGIIVVCAPHIMFFKDTDFDGKVDIRETLYTGFGIKTIERGINNPRWGFDGWIYVGSGGGGGTITGPRLKSSVRLGSSDFRIKADGTAIESITGNVGTFGLAHDEIGNRFPSSGGRPATHALPLDYHYLTRNPHVGSPSTNHGISNYHRGYRLSKPHPWRTRRDRDPNWVKFYGRHETDSSNFSGGCSNEFYSSDLFPSKYHGNLFYCEPSLNIIHRTILTRDGASFHARRAKGEEASEFLASTDIWFRPMCVRVGPDGALYIVDMYREIIEDYSAIPRFLQQQYGIGEGRMHGRLWRLAPKGKSQKEHPKLEELSNLQLVKLLNQATRWQRMTAQRLLVKRKATEMKPQLVRWLSDKESHLGALHALYTLKHLKILEPRHILVALSHPHYGVRFNALKLSEPWLDQDSILLRAVCDRATDTDPSVHLQAALTLGESTKPQATEALLKLMAQYGQGRWVSSAVLSSSSSRSLSMALGTLREFMPEHVRKSLLTSLTATLGGTGVESEIYEILNRAVNLPPRHQEWILKGLQQGVSRSSRLDALKKANWAPLSQMMKSPSETIKNQIAQLGKYLPVPNATDLTAHYDRAKRLLSKREGTSAELIQALQLLTNTSFEELSPLASNFLTVNTSPRLQLQAVRSLSALSDKRVSGVLLKNWSSYTPTIRREVLRGIFSRSDRLATLMNELKNGTVSPSELSSLQSSLLLNHPKKEISEVAIELLSKLDSDEEFQKRVTVYRKALGNIPDIKKGKEVFMKACQSCHKVDGMGFDVGPNLGTILNKPNEAILLEVLSPSSNVDSEFTSYIAITKQGITHTGVLVSETPTSIQLGQEKGVQTEILRKDLLSLEASKDSIMPSNLHEQVSPQGFVDLMAYLRKTLSQ